MLPSWCNDTITVWRAPLVTSRGSKVRDWTQAISHEVSGCSFQPSTSTTGNSAARVQPVTSTAIVYCPPGSDIAEADRIEFDGSIFDVDGVPLYQKSPFGTLNHLLVNVVARKG